MSVANESCDPTMVAPPAGDGPAPAATTVRLGRMVADANLPRQLEPLREGVKKLAWTVFEASLVTKPLSYLYHELLRPQTADYQLRKTGARLSIRHRSGDVDILRKFYAYGYYAWPAEVTAQLTQLRRPLNTLDLGANIGLFEVHTRGQGLPIGEVVAFEPDPDNSAVLDRARAANGADWKIVRACAANRRGEVRFQSGHKNFSRIDPDGDFTVEALDVFPFVERADLVKMNIEGSEWEILEDTRLAAVDAVWIVEYHRLRNPRSDITELVCELFGRAGYDTRVAVSHENNGLVWAWKER
jgi:FkbM family methyltransferase